MQNDNALDTNLSSFRHSKMADIALFSFFVLCLIPITYRTLSVNYLFMLYPIWCAFSGRHFRIPSIGLISVLSLYVILFLAGAAIDYSNGELHFRSPISFILFISIFSLMFVPVTAREIRLFKYAVITVALGLALQAVSQFFWYGGNAAGFSQKGIVGSQRYGFVYIMAFFIIMGRKANLGLPPGLRIGAVTTVLAGMLLTFSRSTVIAFSVAVMIYTVVVAIEYYIHKSENIREIAGRYGLVATALAALFVIMPLPYQFYGHHIVSRYMPVLDYAITTTSGSVATDDAPVAISPQNVEIVNDVFNSAGSEGTRMELWSLILKKVNDNPILGSHYLGMWSIEGAPSGSSHNQLMDVLLRTAWPGLAGYILLLSWLIVCFFKYDRSLFWGLLATLVFGAFHETFKETQGAFLLAFFIAIFATRSQRENERLKELA